MATDSTKTFRQILGIDTASSKVQTVANIIGGALFGGGLYGALKTQYPDFSRVTKNEQSRVGEIGASFSEKTNKEAQGFEADLSGYGNNVVEGVASGLTARGIKDTRVATEATERARSGLSGAYAAARSALARAKVNATSRMDSARIRYAQDMAGNQYDSLMAQYASRMGLWSALGGAGASILAAKPVVKKGVV